MDFEEVFWVWGSLGGCRFLGSGTPGVGLEVSVVRGGISQGLLLGFRGYLEEDHPA